MIIYSSDTGPLYYPGEEYHDPESKRYYNLTYKPPVWSSNIAYVRHLDIVRPSVHNGCMYECLSGGRSSPLEPVFSTFVGDIIEDGNVIWRCLEYNAKLWPADEITESEWLSDDDITLSHSLLINNSATMVRVDAVNPTLDYFKITNRITIAREFGGVEQFDKSFIIKVKQL